MSEKYCDNRSVGVIITNERDEIALLKRARFPIGIAPPAGHIDGHGSPEQAAIDEVYEEVGIRLAIDGLQRTAIWDRRVDNVCRRQNGDHHVWRVYESRIGEEQLRPDPHETKGAAWYPIDALNALALRTRAFKAGLILPSEWAESPGLEEIWLDNLTELGYVTDA